MQRPRAVEGPTKGGSGNADGQAGIRQCGQDGDGGGRSHEGDRAEDSRGPTDRGGAGGREDQGEAIEQMRPGNAEGLEEHVDTEGSGD